MMINFILIISTIISLLGVIGERKDSKLRLYLFVICCISIISLTAIKFFVGS